MKLSWMMINWKEPAVVRGVLGAIVALAGTLGVTSNVDLAGSVDALVIGGFTALPILQALATRAVVWSRASVIKMKRDAVEEGKAEGIAEAVDSKYVVVPQTPGKADHAAENDENQQRAF